MPKYPKWTPPQKRMKKYKDYGVTDKNPSTDKVRWTEFLILVPSHVDRKEIQAALEYFHNLREIDTDFVTVNQLIHQYDGGNFDYKKHGLVKVDKKEFRRLKKKLCGS